ncbi:hypothetical protein WJX75_006831 [Coccomyxa subellipsoidea]|uniref:Uncharacterized protein n=1 Tax=Coccomyxa subellipsoidea TaxID=248742 RepID=A0ABR2YQ42_9CHLO
MMAPLVSTSVDVSAPVAETFLEQELVGQYFFREDQLDRLHKLHTTMWKCGIAFVVVSAATVAGLIQAEFESGEDIAGAWGMITSFFNHLTVGGVARPVDTLLMAGLILYSAIPFEKAVRSKTRQLAYVFQGIDRLTLVFNQLVIASLAVSTIATLEAAVKWPESVTYVSAIFFAAAVVRSAAMWYVLNTHAAHLDDIEATLTAYRGCEDSPLAEVCAPEMPWWDRFAVSISLGHLLQFEPGGLEPIKLDLQQYMAAKLSTDHAEEPLDCSFPQYAFNKSERYLLRTCMNAATTAGLALALQGATTGLLALANLCSHNPSDAISEGINAGHKLLAATFVYGASHTFDQIIYTEGCDIGYLVQGVGRKGLTSLFSNLGILAGTVALADTVAMAAPWIEHSPVFTYIAERSSHEVAHAIISAQRLLVRLLP